MALEIKFSGGNNCVMTFKINIYTNEIKKKTQFDSGRIQVIS